MKERIYQLDSLKFLAMVGIFFNHCTFLKRNVITSDFFETYLHYGGVYVELFIILSGFFSYLTCNDYHWGKNTYRSYITRKAIRLFPVHWLCCIMYLLVLLFLGSLTINAQSILSTILTAGLLQSLTPNTWSFLNAPSWTISTLWILYFFVPLLSNTIKKLTAKQCCMMIIVGGGIYGIINAYCFHLNDVTVWFFYICPISRVISFVGGMLLARFFLLVHESHFAKPKTGNTLRELITFSLIIVFCISFRNYSREGYMYVLLIIYLIFIIADGKGKVSKAMTCQSLLYLSKFSFAFYLIHFIVLMIIASIVEKYEVYLSWHLAICAIVAFLITLGISIPIHIFIEKQIGSYLKKILL